MISISEHDWDHYKTLLENAITFFKFAFAVTATAAGSGIKLQYLDTFSFGRHVTKSGELSLTPGEEDLGFAMLEHCATYLCVVQIHTVLERVYSKPFEIPEPDIQAAFHVARIMRNAFAHNPFAPQWDFQRRAKDKDQTYEVPNVIAIETTALDGKYVRREHYGGPIAVLRLAAYVRSLLDRQSVEDGMQE